MRCGDTFLMSPRSNFELHLWIIITDVDKDSGLVAIVSLTTLRHNVDQTLILRKGDHPFVEHESAVYFTDARLAELKGIDAHVTAGTIRPHQPCSATLLKEIQQGALACDLTPHKVLLFCRRLLHK
jgi:hypothetical protein